MIESRADQIHHDICIHYENCSSDLLISNESCVKLVKNTKELCIIKMIAGEYFKKILRLGNKFEKPMQRERSKLKENDVERGAEHRT